MSGLTQSSGDPRFQGQKALGKEYQLSDGGECIQKIALASACEEPTMTTKAFPLKKRPYRLDTSPTANALNHARDHKHTTCAMAS